MLGAASTAFSRSDENNILLLYYYEYEAFYYYYYYDDDDECGTKQKAVAGSVINPSQKNLICRIWYKIWYR